METPSTAPLTTQSRRSRKPRKKGQSRPREWLPVALAGLLLVLLAVLAAMQHHWLGRASEADLQRTSASLQAAASRFAADFNRELGDLLRELVPVLFRGPEADEIVASVERWQERAAWPELVRGVWEVSVSSTGTTMKLISPGSDGSAVDGAAGAAVPQEIQRLGELLAERVTQELDSSSQNPFLEHPRVLMAEVPAIVIPRPGAFRPGRPERHSGRGSDRFGPDGSGSDGPRSDGPGSGERERRRHWRQWLGGPGEEPTVWVIHLDDEVLRQQILPELAERHFSSESGLGLRVSDLDGGPVWSLFGQGRAADSVGRPVARTELFGPFRAGPEPSGRRPPRRGLYAPMHEVLATAAGVDRGQWILEVFHPAGSLDAAVESARHRSLMLSFVILLVLAGSILLLAQGARRAQALARRQMEFVAGVTHELRTPVAALRSAGQNLAHGVVKPDRVKTYGELVDREGRRLEDSVDQILAFAGLSGGRELRKESLDPIAAVERAVDELRPLLDDRSVTVDIKADIKAGDIEASDDLPRVEADAESLGRALRNLIQNAALHGRGDSVDEASEGWVGVDVESRDGQVLFHVRDRGPGIDPSDRKRIFEPFVRGSGLAASNVPGSGLGLALVRQVADAHGGSISLNQDEEFTTFTLTLPANSR